MNIGEDSYLKSYASFCDFFNDKNIDNITNINFEKLLNYEQFKKFIYEYYNSENSIDNILLKYNIDKKIKRLINEMLPDFESNYICQYCHLKMIYSKKSKTAYKEGFKYSDKICLKCKHKIVFGGSLCDCNTCKEDRKKEFENANNLKLNKLRQLIEKIEEKPFTFERFRFMPLKYKTYFLTILMYLYDENNYFLGHSFKQVNLLKGINFAPTIDFGFDIISELLRFSLIKFKLNQNNLDNIEFKNESYNYNFTPYKNDYMINIKSHELFSFTNIVKECETILSDNIINTKEEALILWKKIGLEELKEYTYYLFEKYNFNTDYIGDSIIEKLELILEDFSVSQGYAILYSSITGAASYKQTGITHKHAVNTINTYISNHIAKRKSGEYETKGYKRDFNTQQTAVSIVFFNHILKIGNKGFEQVPKIENIPDNFFMHFINEDNIFENIKNTKELNKEILLNLDKLLNKFYFIDIVKSLSEELFNKDLNNEIDFYNDYDVLEKLKQYILNEKLSIK